MTDLVMVAKGPTSFPPTSVIMSNHPPPTTEVELAVMSSAVLLARRFAPDPLVFAAVTEVRAAMSPPSE